MTVSLKTWAELELFGQSLRLEGEKDALSVTLHGELSLGEAILGLLQLIDPYRSEHVLPPPWSVLNEIRLSDPKLTYGKLGIEFMIDSPGLPMPFGDVRKIGLRYGVKDEEAPADDGKSVFLQLEGSILGHDLEDLPGFPWDLENDGDKPPMRLPGAGEKLLHVSYLGLGQRVALHSDAETLEDVLVALKQAAGADPWTGSGALRFARDSNWLFATELVLLETLSLGVIFNDPNLYGLRVVLAGERAKKLGGLSFEILYRKIADNLGVYHTELKLPDVVRQFDLGAVSVTLPIIDVDVYTNGAFLIDLGFPRNGDYSRSTSLEMFPYFGKGGLYFGVLDSATSSAVPAVANGAFAPVVTFGLGLQVGLGKTFNKGILSAGFTIGVEGILEGVYAVFHEDGTEEQHPFFRVGGQLTLIGHLYGGVDFAVIKARVDVMVYAGAGFVLESHKTAEVRLIAGVRVAVSVKVLFVRIHFSFHADIEERTTVGHATKAPWRVIEEPAAADHSILEARAAPAMPHLLSLPSWDAISLRAESGDETDAQGHLQVRLLVSPQVTLACEASVETTDAVVGDPSPSAEMALLLFVGAPRPGGAEEAPSDFERIARRTFQWAVRSFLKAREGRGRRIDRQAVLLLQDEVRRGSRLTQKSVLDFVEKNFFFVFEQMKEEDYGPLTLFPFLPTHGLRGPSSGSERSFGHRTTGPAYRGFLEEFFVDSLPASSSNGSSDELPAPGEGSDTLAGELMYDYFRMILSDVLDCALDLDWSHPRSEEWLIGKLAETGFKRPSGVVSRFLLHGVRLPDPAAFEAAADPQALSTHPAYALVGQQRPAPDAEALTGWHLFRMQGGMVNDLTFSLAGAFQSRLASLQSLLDESDGPLSPLWPEHRATSLPTFQSVPRQFELPKPTVWEGPGGAARGLFNIPTALRSAVRASVSSERTALGLEVVPSAPWRPDDPPADALPHKSCVRLEFTIQRVSSTGGRGLRRPVVVSESADDASERTGTDHFLYEVMGTADADPAELGDLSWADETCTIHLLYEPNAAGGGADSADDGTSGEADGGPSLRSDDLEGGEALLLKANLSTRTRPPPEFQPAFLETADAEPPPPPSRLLHAAPSEPRNFLTLLREAGAVNSGGFFLYYRNAEGEGLPKSLFNQSHTARLVVIVEEGAQVSDRHNAFVLDSLPGDHALTVQATARRFEEAGHFGAFGAGEDPIWANASAPVLAAGVPIAVGEATYTVRPGDSLLDVARQTDRSLAEVVASVRDTDPPGLIKAGSLLNPYADWVLRRATVPPGHVGLKLIRPHPPADTDPKSPEVARDQLANLYNLLDFRVADAGVFRAGREMLPIGPTEIGGGPEGQEVWCYERVVGIADLARETERVTGRGAIRGPAVDPYAGIGRDVTIQLQYRDLFGNHCSPLGDLPSLTLPVRYTDPVLGLHQWPGTSCVYSFEPAAEDAVKDGRSGVLRIELDYADLSATGDGMPYRYGRDRAEMRRSAYQRAYDQLARSDVDSTAVFSLDPTQGYPVDKESLLEYLADVHTYLGTPRAVMASDGMIGSTLRDVADHYSVDPRELADLNRDNPALVTQPLEIPDRGSSAVFAEDTLESVAARNGITVEGLVEANLDLVADWDRVELPLHVELPESCPLVPADGEEVTFRDLAEREGCSVERLVAANRFVAGLVRTDQSLTTRWAAPTEADATEGSVIDAVVRPQDTVATLAAHAFARLDPAAARGASWYSGGFFEPLIELALTPGAPFLLPPRRRTLEVRVAVETQAIVTPLTVEVVIERHPNSVDPDLVGEESVRRSRSVIRPDVAPGATDTNSLLAFAGVFEDVFAGLKLAVGALTTDAEAAGRLLAVAHQNQSSSYRIAPDARFFAPEPLSNEPWSDMVRLRSYTQTEGLSDTADTTVHFTDEDLDEWHRDFLETLDLMRTGPYAARVFKAAPAVYRGLSASLESIVEGIGKSIRPVFDTKPPSAALEAARKRFREALLRDLSAMYETHAIVQFDTTARFADVCDEGSLRVFGQPVHAPYRIRAGTTLRDVARDHGITVETLVDLIGDERGLLQTPGGTLGALGGSAARLESTAGDRDLLREGAILQLVRRELVVGEGETARSAFAYLAPDAFSVPKDDPTYDRAVRLFAEINADTPGLFLGGTYVLGQVAKSSDTLASLAARAGEEAHELAGRLIDERFGTLLKAGVRLYYLAVQPTVSLSTARLDLYEPNAGGSATEYSKLLTFLCRVPASRGFRHLRLSLDFEVQAVEYGISALAGDDEYEGSRWLSFVIPPPPDRLGEVDLPVPVRTHPANPRINAESIVPALEKRRARDGSEAIVPTLADLDRYELRLEYSANRYAQDELDIVVETNTPHRGPEDFASDSSRQIDPETGAPAPRDGAITVADTLAQYAFVSEALKADLLAIPRLDLPLPEDDDPALAAARRALDALSEIARLVAAGWAARSPTTALESRGMSFSVRQEGAWSQSGGGDEAPRRLRWEVSEEPVEPTRVAGSPTLESMGSAHSAAAAPVAQPARPVFRLEIPGFRAVKDHVVQASLGIVSNRRLVAGHVTDPSFVYRSRTVSTSKSPVPGLVHGEPFDAGLLLPLDEGAAPTLENRLVTLFGRLLRVRSGAGSAAEVRAAVSVAFLPRLFPEGEPSGMPGALLPKVPIAIWPERPLPLVDPGHIDRSTDLMAFCGDIDQTLRAWVGANDPVLDGAAFTFDISLHADVAGAESPPRLLWLKDVRLGLDGLLRDS